MLDPSPRDSRGKAPSLRLEGGKPTRTGSFSIEAPLPPGLQIVPLPLSGVQSGIKKEQDGNRKPRIKLYVTYKIKRNFTATYKIYKRDQPPRITEKPTWTGRRDIILRNVVLLQKQPQPSALLWSVRQNTNAPQWGKISR